MNTTGRNLEMQSYLLDPIQLKSGKIKLASDQDLAPRSNTPTFAPLVTSATANLHFLFATLVVGARRSPSAPTIHAPTRSYGRTTTWDGNLSREELATSFPMDWISPVHFFTIQ